MAEEDDEYEQEFEASGEYSLPARSPSVREASFMSESAPPSPIAPSESRQSALQPGSDSGHPTPRRAKPVVKKPIRSVLDQSPWTYTIDAKRIRGLRIPVAPSAASSDGNAAGIPTIRDLRVFGVVDKQSIQTHGSRWKQEARVVENARPAVSSRRSPSHATSPGRRSGFFEEAQWKHDDGELQWTFTLDKFRKLKAYSPRIKLYVFGIGVNAHADSVRVLSEDSPRRHKESIVSLGWFFLDMRTPDLPERWLKLQNSPFGGEIQVASSFLPADLGRTRASNAAAKDARSMEAAAAATRRREHLFAADADSLQLGDRRGNDIFLVSVFIRGAMGLASVARSALGSKEHERLAMQAGFWLSYSLFDVVVQTDVFYNLDRAEFAPIRDSFRVKSCKEDLREFVRGQRVLTVYLCTQDRVLASAELALDALLGQLEMFVGRDQGAQQEDTATVSGTFGFAGSGTDGNGVTASFSIEYVETVSTTQDIDGGSKHQKKKDEQRLQREFIEENNERSQPGGSTSPTCISVSHVKLKAEALALYAEKEAIELEVMIGEQAVRCPIHFNVFTADDALGNCPDLTVELDSSVSEPVQVSVSCFSSATDHTIATSSSTSLQLDGRDQLQYALFSQDGRRIGECTLVHSSTGSEERKRSTSQDELRSIPGLSHTYRLLIRLAALRDFETSRPVVVSYTNPFTGRERVETPLISVVENAEARISDAYCVFELHYDETSLKQAMESPIILDVSLAMPDGSRETIGSAIFSLNFLFYSEQGVCCAHSSCEAVFRSKDDADAHWDAVHREETASPLRPAAHSIKTCSIYLPVMSPGPTSSTRRVGALKIEAYIEDTGPMSEDQVRLVEETRVSRLIKSDEHRVKFENRPAMRSTSSHETQLHTASMAVEPNKEATADHGQNAATEPRHAGSSDKEIQEMKARLQKERNSWLQEQNAQQTQWRKRVAEMEKARMDELEEEWARREEERSTVLKAAQVEYQKLEQKLRVTLAEVETRERKLALAESALERDQRMLREDTDLLRKRLQSEQSHSVSLAQKQVDVLEKRVAELQSQLAAAEKRALQVEEDFAEYRKQQRKVPESKLREEISSLKGQVGELEKAKLMETRAKENAEANVEKMKAQLEKMAKLVQAEKKKNESRVVDDLEKLRLKYVAREERYVLDGDREELRAIKKQLDELRHVHVQGHDPEAVDKALRVKRSRARVNPQRSSRDVTSPRSRCSRASASSPTHRDGRRHSWSSAEVDAQSPSPAKSPVRLTTGTRPRQNENGFHNTARGDKELRRLERERESLLASGAYDHDSYLVRELERRIVLRQDQLAQP